MGALSVTSNPKYQKPFAPPSAETIVDAGLDVLENVSKFFWAVIIAEPDSGCQYWPFTPPERYLGPWNKALNNPILIISNTVSSTLAVPLCRKNGLTIFSCSTTPLRPL